MCTKKNLNFTSRYRLFTLLLFWSVKSLFSQICEGTLSGSVNDFHDGSPIVGAVVSIKPGGLFAQTDSEGRYKIQNICAGKIKINITHPACQAVTKNLFFKENQIVDFKMEHHINELDEVVVRENNLKKLTPSLPETVLSQNRLDAYSAQTLAEALNTISGVSIVKTGSGILKPMIHGMYGSRVGIVNNAFRLQDQEWGADHSPSVDANAFESIQLIKGAAALKYGGDTAGGVIVMQAPKPPLKDSLYGKTIVNTFSNGRGLGIITDLTKATFKGNYFNVQGTLKRSGDRVAPDYSLTNTGVHENNIAIKFGRNRVTQGWEAGYSFYSNAIGILRSSHIGNVEDLVRAIASDRPLVIKPYSNDFDSPKQETDHHTAYAKWFKRYANASKWNVHYNFQFNNRKEFDIRRGVPNDLAAIDLQLATHDFATDYEWKSAERYAHNLGIAAQYQDNFSNPETGVRRLIPDYQRYQLGAFYTLGYRPDNTLSFDMGARVDYIHLDAKKYYKRADWEDRRYENDFSSIIVKTVGNQLLVNPRFDYLNVSANLGSSFEWSQSITTSLNYIFSQRAPNAAELFSDGLHHSLATIESGELRLEKEITQKGLLTLDYKNKSTSVSATAHYAHINDYILSEPTRLEQTIRGAFPVWQYRAEDAVFWGFDMDLNYTFSKSFAFYANASFVQAQEKDSKKPLIAIPPFNTTQSITYKKPNQRWEFQLSTQSVWEQRRYPNLNFKIPIFVNDEYVERTVDISTPPKSYTLLNMNLTYYPQKKQKKNLLLRFTAQNLLNTAFRDYLNRLRYYADEQGRNVQLQLIFKY